MSTNNIGMNTEQISNQHNENASNNNQEKINLLENYEIHHQYKNIHNIAYTYLINEQLLRDKYEHRNRDDSYDDVENSSTEFSSDDNDSDSSNYKNRGNFRGTVSYNLMSFYEKQVFDKIIYILNKELDKLTGDNYHLGLIKELEELIKVKSKYALNVELMKLSHVLYTLVLKVVYNCFGNNGEMRACFWSPHFRIPIQITNQTEIKKSIKKAFRELEKQVCEITKKSFWYIDSIEQIEVNIEQKHTPVKTELEYYYDKPNLLTEEIIKKFSKYHELIDNNKLAIFTEILTDEHIEIIKTQYTVRSCFVRRMCELNTNILLDVICDICDIKIKNKKLECPHKICWKCYDRIVEINGSKAKCPYCRHPFFHQHDDDSSESDSSNDDGWYVIMQ